MPTGVLGFRAQSSHGSIQQDEFRRQRTNVTVVGFEVFLAEFNISPRNTDVVTTKRLPTSPTTMVVSSCRCREGSPVLLKCPRRAAPSTDRKVSTAATSAFRFFSFHVIRAMTRLAGVRRQADPGDRDPPDQPAASRLEPAKIYSQRQRQTKTMGAAIVRAAWTERRPARSRSAPRSVRESPRDHQVPT